MKIGVDIDGVLFPWVDVANEALVAKFGIEDPGPHTSWSYLKDQCLTREQWTWLWTAEGQQRVFGQVWRAYSDATEATRRLLRAGHEVHFVTHRDPRRTATLTAMFLSYHFSAHPWAGVHIIQNGTPKRSLGRWDVFIDDKPDTVFDFLANTTTKVFAPARPWNVDELRDLRSSLVLYDDPQDIVEWVEAQS